MRTRYLLPIVVLAIAGTAFAYAQQRSAQKQDSLMSGATVPVDVAQKTARDAIRGGAKLVESEIEEEDGWLLYSFAFETRDGVTEVEIDANTGVVVEIEHDGDHDQDDDE